MEYLEERYPEPPLLAADPADRALARLWIFRHDDFTRPYYALRRGETARTRASPSSSRGSTPRSKAPMARGRRVRPRRIAYVPWLLRARDLLGVDLDPYPALSGWLERLLARPAVAAEADVASRTSDDFRRRRRRLARRAPRRGRPGGRRRARPERAHARPHRRLEAARARLAAAGSRRETVQELAQEIALRLRRHGITGEERLVLVDRGDGVGAMPAAQLAELAGHPLRSCSAASPPGRASCGGPVELEPVRHASLSPALRALPTRQELVGRLHDPQLSSGRAPRRGVHGQAREPVRSAAGAHPGRGHVEVEALFAAPGRPQPAERIRELVGRPEGAEIVAYCHSGSRSALATSRCAAPATTPATTPARGTSGAGTPSFRSNADSSGRSAMLLDNGCNDRRRLRWKRHFEPSARSRDQ